MISWASIEAMPDTERAAPRWVSCRSILCAIERVSSMTMTKDGLSDTLVACRSTDRSPPVRGVADIDRIFRDDAPCDTDLRDSLAQRA